MSQSTVKRIDSVYCQTRCPSQSTNKLSRTTVKGNVLVYHQMDCPNLPLNELSRSTVKHCPSLPSNRLSRSTLEQIFPVCQRTNFFVLRQTNCPGLTSNRPFRSTIKRTVPVNRPFFYSHFSERILQVLKFPNFRFSLIFPIRVPISRPWNLQKSGSLPLDRL